MYHNWMKWPSRDTLVYKVLSAHPSLVENYAGLESGYNFTFQSPRWILHGRIYTIHSHQTGRIIPPRNAVRTWPFVWGHSHNGIPQTSQRLWASRRLRVSQRPRASERLQASRRPRASQRLRASRWLRGSWRPQQPRRLRQLRQLRQLQRLQQSQGLRYHQKLLAGFQRLAHLTCILTGGAPTFWRRFHGSAHL